MSFKTKDDNSWHKVDETSASLSSNEDSWCELHNSCDEEDSRIKPEYERNAEGDTYL